MRNAMVKKHRQLLMALIFVVFLCAIATVSAVAGDKSLSLNGKKLRNIYVSCYFEVTRSNFLFFDTSRKQLSDLRDSVAAKVASTDSNFKGDIGGKRAVHTVEQIVGRNLKLAVDLELHEAKRIGRQFDAEVNFFGPDKCDRFKRDRVLAKSTRAWSTLLSQNKADALLTTIVRHRKEANTVLIVSYLYLDGMANRIPVASVEASNVDEVSQYLDVLAKELSTFLDVMTNETLAWIGGDYSEVFDSAGQLLRRASQLVEAGAPDASPQDVRTLENFYLQNAVKLAPAGTDLAIDAMSRWGKALLSEDRAAEGHAMLQPVLGTLDKAAKSHLLEQIGDSYGRSGNWSPATRLYLQARPHSKDPGELGIKILSLQLFGEMTSGDQSKSLGYISDHFYSSVQTATGCDYRIAADTANFLKYAQYQEFLEAWLRKVGVACTFNDLQSEQEFENALTITDAFYQMNAREEDDQLRKDGYETLYLALTQLVDLAQGNPRQVEAAYRARYQRAFAASEAIEKGDRTLDSLEGLVRDYQLAWIASGCATRAFVELSGVDTKDLLLAKRCILGAQQQRNHLLNMMEAGVLAQLPQFKNLAVSPINLDLQNCLLGEENTEGGRICTLDSTEKRITDILYFMAANDHGDQRKQASETMCYHMTNSRAELVNSVTELRWNFGFARSVYEARQRTCSIGSVCQQATDDALTVISIFEDARSNDVSLPIAAFCPDAKSGR